MIELIPKTNINFMKYSVIALPLSLVVFISALVIWFTMGEAKYGVDFTGGLEIIVKAPDKAINSETIRGLLDKAGIKDSLVQSFEAFDNKYAVRIGGANIEAERIKTTISKVLGEEKIEVLSSSYIGPTIGSELRQQALIAVIICLLGITLYVAFRFEFAFGLGALVSVLHDVVVCTGLFLLLGNQLNMSAVAAVLTVAGYSINDTVVIFDRMREEIFKLKDFDLVEVMNSSINGMLGRTMVTNLLTGMSVLSLYLLGGGSIHDLSLILLIGIVAGTYSTIYIAGPVVIVWARFRNRRAAEA